MYDIHTHLYWESYDADRDEVIARAHRAGVEKMFVIGCTPEESRQSVMLAEKYPELFAVVGLHPHFFNQLVEKNQSITGEIEDLRLLAREQKVVAIGECGLDYFHPDPTVLISDEQKRLQKEGFLLQIALAEELQLPLIIHCRPTRLSMDAYEDIFSILHSTSYQLPAILHCYMGDTEVTKQFLLLPNVFFSFTANITYPVKKSLIGTKDDLTETVKRIPLERLFVETDCPFLAPQEQRGERNEPAYVVAVARKVASLQGVPLDILEQSLASNVQRTFSL